MEANPQYSRNSIPKGFLCSAHLAVLIGSIFMSGLELNVGIPTMPNAEISEMIILTWFHESLH